MKKAYWLIIVLVAAAAVAAWLLILRKEKPSADLAAADVDAGRRLAAQYCQSCHAVPDPALLDKKSWRSVLPEMGLYLGIHSPQVKVLAEQDKGFYPMQPVMAQQDWQKILSYYEQAAPEALPIPPQPVLPPVPYFNSISAPAFLNRSNVMASFVKIDTSVSPSRLFVYDAYSSQLFLFSADGLLDSVQVNGILVDLGFYKNEIYGCTIGEQLQMGPDRQKQGTVFRLRVGVDGKMRTGPPLFRQLARSVQVLPEDLNDDGRIDFVVCEFGKLTGSLTLMQSKREGGYERRVLRGLPGSVKAYVRRNKASGLKDIWVLFAQGDEGIWQFVNKGKGHFEEKKILQFPPVYGSAYFDLADMDQDGLDDIVYACGDNGDGTRILKPYHGVYVFRNEGNGQYRQQYFYPLYGCYKLMAADYRGSGKKDIAAIGYFTDPANPRFFVYLQNLDGGGFQAHAPSPGLAFEKAITMDAGDFNGDGRPDIVLGNTFLQNDPSRAAPLFGLMETAR